MTKKWEEAEKDCERTRLSLVFSFSTPGYIMFFLFFFQASPRDDQAIRYVSGG